MRARKPPKAFFAREWSLSVGLEVRDQLVRAVSFWYEADIGHTAAIGIKPDIGNIAQMAALSA